MLNTKNIQQICDQFFTLHFLIMRTLKNALNAVFVMYMVNFAFKVNFINTIVYMEVQCVMCANFRDIALLLKT